VGGLRNGRRGPCCPLVSTCAGPRPGVERKRRRIGHARRSAPQRGWRGLCKRTGASLQAVKQGAAVRGSGVSRAAGGCEAAPCEHSPLGAKSMNSLEWLAACGQSAGPRVSALGRSRPGEKTPEGAFDRSPE
jgi:hypothetical protein